MATADSNPFTISIDSTGATGSEPSWYTSMSAGAWSIISKTGGSGVNDMDEVNAALSASTNPNYPNNPPYHGTSGFNGFMDVWSSAVLASGQGTHGTYYIHSGGHGYYGGSEVYAFDIDTQTWSLAIPPYQGADAMSYSSSTALFPDNTPIMAHNWDGLTYSPDTNRVYRINGQTANALTSISGARGPLSFACDDLASKWTVAANTASWTHQRSACCYDSNRQRIYTIRDGNLTGFGYYDVTTGLWSPKLGYTFNDGAGNTVDVNAVMQFSPDIDGSIYVQWRSGNKNVLAFDHSLPDAGTSKVGDWIILNESGGPTRNQGMSVEWSTSRGAFLFYEGGVNAVWEFKPPASNWQTSAWTWTSLTSTGGPTSGGVNPTFKKFRLMEFSNGNEVGILQLDPDGPTYAYKVP